MKASLGQNHRFIANAEAVRRSMMGPGSMCPSCRSTHTYRVGPTNAELGAALVEEVLGDPGLASLPLAAANHRWKCNRCGMIWMA